jgi:Clp amino terminal domain, pathogenicity island component
VFARFTDRARGVIVTAEDEARSLGQQRTGSEHVLLGLLLEKEGLAGQVLEELGVDIEGVRGRIAEAALSADADAERHVLFTTPARMALEQALRQSLSLGQNFIGTEHLLLGLLSVETCTGAQILEGMGVAYEAARAEIARRSPGRPEDAREGRVGAWPGRVSPARDPYSAVLAGLARRGDPDMSTVCMLKERALADRRFFVITYTDQHGSQQLLLAGAQRHEDGFWGTSSGSCGPRPAPRRDGRWVYLEGWSDEDHFCLGGELLVDGAEVSEVRLAFEDGSELVDDVTNGVVLFVAERPFAKSLGVHIHDSTGALLASHPAH